MVELSVYQTDWPVEFAEEARRITRALSAQVDAVEHIGSTAVPSLLAKPIIDLAARATTATDPFRLGPELARLGYEQHRAGPKTHAVYIRSTEGRRTHILHVFAAHQWEHCNQRVFRDKLLHDTGARQRYQALKQSLASTLDGRDYTSAKRALIEELLNEERAARGLSPTQAWDK